MKIIETKDAFIKAYNRFIASSGGNRLNNDAIDIWYDAVQEAHKDVRNVIGGTVLEKTIITKEDTIPLDANDPWLAAVIKHMPEYLKQYELTIADLVLPHIKKFKNIATTKHMRTYAVKNLHDDVFSYISSKTSAVNAIDTLATRFAANKIKNGKFIVRLRTDPMAFIMLGHYGHDTSCFANDGSNWMHKYKIGMKHHSYVMTIDNDAKKTIARCWGFYDPQNKHWNTLNHYFVNLTSSMTKYILNQFFDGKYIASGLASCNNDIYLNSLTNINANSPGNVLLFQEKAQKNQELIKITLPKYSKSYKEVFNA